MSDEQNSNNSPRRTDSSYARLSRSAGIASYRRRRRQGKAFKWIAAIILIAIIGSTAVLFGQRILDMPLLTPAQTNETETKHEESKSEQSVIPTVQPAQITLSAVGDVVLNGAAAESGITDNGGYDYTSLFSHVSAEIKKSDIRIVGQETNLPGEGFGYGNWTPLNGPVELGHAEVAAGFNVVLRASDHAMDNGTDGLHNETQWWQSDYPKIALLGIADPDTQEQYAQDYVNNVYIYDKDGFKVAILNHTWNVEEDQARYISALDEQKIATDVQRARDAGAQMIVACPHWGEENNIEVVEEETNFAQIYANNGVDVIIGMHPRVLQRAEVLQGPKGHKTVCFYSLGCFTSSLEMNNFVGGLAQVTLSRDDTGTCSVSSAVLEPVVTRRANKNEYSTYLLRDYTEELGRTGWDYLLPEAVTQMCVDSLGESFNVDEGILRLV